MDYRLSRLIDIINTRNVLFSVTTTAHYFGNHYDSVVIVCEKMRKNNTLLYRQYARFPHNCSKANTIYFNGLDHFFQLVHIIEVEDKIEYLSSFYKVPIPTCQPQAI